MILKDVFNETMNNIISWMLCPLDGGRSTMKSMLITSHGLARIGIRCGNPCAFPLLTFTFWHTLHVRT